MEITHHEDESLVALHAAGRGVWRSCIARANASSQSTRPGAPCGGHAPRGRAFIVVHTHGCAMCITRTEAQPRSPSGHAACSTRGVRVPKVELGACTDITRALRDLSAAESDLSAPHAEKASFCGILSATGNRALRELSASSPRPLRHSAGNTVNYNAPWRAAESSRRAPRRARAEIPCKK